MFCDLLLWPGCRKCPIQFLVFQEYIAFSYLQSQANASLHFGRGCLSVCENDAVILGSYPCYEQNTGQLKLSSVVSIVGAGRGKLVFPVHTTCLLLNKAAGVIAFHRSESHGLLWLQATVTAVFDYLMTVFNCICYIALK